VQSYLSSFQIGTGTNYLTNRGLLLDVSNPVIFPGYINSSSRATMPDLMAFTYGGIPLSEQVLHIPATFADSRQAVGTLVMGSGYGDGGTPATGYERTGNIMAGQSEMTAETIFPGRADEYYMKFFADNSAIPLNSRNADRGSGRQEYNLIRELVGMGLLEEIAPRTDSISRWTYLAKM
jgi:hypothetical protein